MTVKEAEEILERNYTCSKGSLIFDLHERSRFSEEHFGNFYDCIVTLGKEVHGSEKKLETGGKIAVVCQCILAEMIYHFDRNDLSELENFPRNYQDYIERLNAAVDAYFHGGHSYGVFFGGSAPEPPPKGYRPLETRCRSALLDWDFVLCYNREKHRL